MWKNALLLVFVLEKAMIVKQIQLHAVMIREVSSIHWLFICLTSSLGSKKFFFGV